MAGLNTEIEHRGSSFHVQTQDKGLGAHYVETIIYKSGRVLSSRRSSYTSNLNSPDLNRNIQNLIQKQHYTVLAEIKKGKFDHL